ncbi:UDP-N-acetylmuramoyl-L-alanyl-D-glutamate--2,6-diaminopimelate ligase [Candidatus Saccharibacteria bacterium]|nr:UDP-N-acetylmuramoyl-L-alanyl-D-glutamate--2,6-diaminopimelate ligase [Candidatus Saccharibacteria bacterium]
MLPYHFLQSVVAGAKYHHPAKSLKVIAVTGTNGKTTTCFMIWQMLRHAGYKAGLMTTVAYGVDTLTPELGHMTTVDAATLNRRIREIADAGAEYLVLETTSHALAEYRTLGIPVEVAVFTNLTHDHLDYHKTMEKYRAAKGRLFARAKFAVINADDENADFFKNLSRNYITYGIKNGDFRAKSIKLGISGIKYSCGDIIIETKIPGEFNVYNSLAAAAVGAYLGLDQKQIHDGIKSLSSVEGRMNLIDEGQPFTVIVDYAHAPDALEKVFESIGAKRFTATDAEVLGGAPEKSHPTSHTAKSRTHHATGRVISVHGGAGQRDPSTRFSRGAILAQYSDIVIITEDDSRDEPPESIAAEFIRGAKKHGKREGEDLFKELDRAQAIKLALKKAHPGDIVLILGKGHEKSILRADGPHDFEDAKVTRAALESLGYHPK